MSQPKPPQPRASGNQGIIGNVSANVLAVGSNARATQINHLDPAAAAEFRSATADLRTALDRLQLPPAARGALERDVAQLEQAAKQPEHAPAEVKGFLERMVDKIKLLDGLAGGAASLIEPIGKIAGLFHLSLAALGWF